MNQLVSRRTMLGASVAVAGAMATHVTAADQPVEKPRAKFRYCLNTSTIAGQKLSLAEQIDVTAKAGYDSIELWIRDIQQYVEGGGKLPDIRKRISDSGLRLESAIGFASWIVNDDAQRRASLQMAERDMQWVHQLGGRQIAAPPAGATSGERIDLDIVAERYAALLAVGRKLGVTPLLEIWGPSKNLSRLSELAYVAIAAQQKEARMLPDVYHIYRGGSDFGGLEVFSGESIGLFHLNDYPDIPRDKITDADRVYPGDGIAPLTAMLRTLTANGYRGTLSLELFNRKYWQQDALTVARTGLNKMRTAVTATEK